VISYALVCDSEHKFDAWFASADAYEEQRRRGIGTCPISDSGKVEQALMAPALARAGTEKMALSIGHPQHAQLQAAMRALRDKVTSEADYVGDRFAEEARKIHFKDVAPRGIYGEATREEVSGLIEDGVDFMPLPTLPEEHN
jgi:hypothetical protein